MKKIAVFLNEDKKLDNFYNCSTIMVYSGDESSCSLVEEKEYSKLNPTTAKAIIADTGKIAELVAGCDAVVAGDIAGIAYNVFDKNQFNIFTIQDNSPEAIQLIFTDLAEFDREVAARKAARKEVKPHETDEPGVYYFDLFTAMKENPDLSSKKMLQEFFDNVPFIILKLKADHLPPWIERDERFDISYENSEQVKNIVITKTKCN